MKGIILFTLFCLIGALFIVGIIFNQRLINVLKTKHTKLWHSLGNPTLLLNNSIRNNMQLLNFIQNKSYLEYKDQELIRVASFLRIFNILFIVAFTIVFIIAAVLILQT